MLKNMIKVGSFSSAGLTHLRVSDYAAFPTYSNKMKTICFKQTFYIIKRILVCDKNHLSYESKF